MKKQKVWFEVWPIYGIKAVVIKRNWLLGSLIIARDFNGKCFKEWVSNKSLIERT